MEKQVRISTEPVNVLFDRTAMSKKDVWEINLSQILEILTDILRRSGKKDLRVAGMAALSSSLIYNMKVRSIFDLQKAVMERKPVVRRTDVDIEVVDLPYRHEATYPVSLEDLLGMLENLILSISGKEHRKRIRVEEEQVPDISECLISVEATIGRYKNVILERITPTGASSLQEIVADMDLLDSIRCFFAVLFMAKDAVVGLEQIGDDIRVTLQGASAPAT